MAKLRAAVIRLSSIVSTFEKKLSVARFPLPPVFYHTMLFWVTISGTSSPRSRNFRLNIFVKTIVKYCTKNSHRYWAHASVPQAILRLIVKDVVRTGVKVIWTEKPIALSIAEIDSMNQVCNENIITLLINCFQCWTSLFYIKPIYHSPYRHTLRQLWLTIVQDLVTSIEIWQRPIWTSEDSIVTL